MTAIPLLQPAAPDPRVSLLDFSLPELEAFLADLGQPKFRARQVWEWIYKRYVADFDAMTNLPKPLREQLAAKATLTPLQPVAEMVSLDADTLKTLFQLPDGQTIETVLMLYDERRTLCISSQAGCAMGCTFCATAQGGLARNLTAGRDRGPGAPLRPLPGRPRRSAHHKRGPPQRRDQHRADGHGRADAQLQKRLDGPAPPHRPRRLWPGRTPHHAQHGRPRPHDRPHGRGGFADRPGRQPARAQRRPAQPIDAHQQGLQRRRAAGLRAPLYRQDAPPRHL